MEKILKNISEEFIFCFVEKSRWKYIVKGLGNTLAIAAVAVALGIVIGAIVAAVRTSYDREYDKMKPGFGKAALGFFNWLSKVYVTVFRGTPVMIQIMIMFFVIFTSARNGVPVAMLTFGINSGAYVSEIIRGGINGVDAGQYEACEALGLGYLDTMWNVIIPQAIKTVLPALCNEFIALLKETSVACYVAVTDLTKAGEIIRSNTYSQAMPLLMVALLYLLLVVILSKLVEKLERRLRKSDLRN